jgi:hypothetical protein
MRHPKFQEHDMTGLRRPLCRRLCRLLCTVVAGCIGLAGFVQPAVAGGPAVSLISTEQVAASEGLRSGEQSRMHLLETLNRADVAQALTERGVNIEQARARVAALSDAEAAQIAAQLDSAPAGAAGDVLGVAIFVFVLLLITDLLGYTHIFPFVRAIR